MTTKFIVPVALPTHTVEISVEYSIARGDEYLIVRDMVGLNDRDLTDVFHQLAVCEDSAWRAVASEVLALVQGTFVDMRAAHLPPSSRLYRDGAF
jgi:hypothetical protein